MAETCRKYEIAPALYYRWKDELEEEGKAALGGSHLQIDTLKNVLGE